MEKRRLGRSSLETVPIVFGGNVLGWTVDQKSANKLLDQFVDLGFNAITAGSKAGTRRVIMVCQAPTISAATGIGSTAWSGIDAWPP